MRTSDQCLRLGMEHITKSLSLSKGLTPSHLTQTWSGMGLEVQANIQVEITNQSQHINLSLHCDNRLISEQTISLTCTKPHYGGKRWWFICPITGIKTSTLYCDLRSTLFASRKAQYIRYTSQEESALSRLMRKERKLRLRYDVSPGFACCPKLKGMHENTYQKRNAAYSRINKALIEAIQFRFAGVSP